MRRILPVVLAGAVLASAAGCAGPATAEDSGESTVIAKIGEREITREQITEKAASALAALRQQEYEIVESALEQEIDEILLEAAAEKESLTREAFIEREVEQAVAVPTDEEVETFYEQNRGRLPGRTLDQVRDQIARYLMGQRQQERYQQIVKDLRKEANVVVLLDPPRVEVSADDDPVFGSAEAPVEIVAFSDYECPYCSSAEEVVQRLLTDYGKDVRVVFRDFPLEFHEHAIEAAEAAGCAEEQGQFEAMHAKLFANQKALGTESLVGYAREIGIDEAEFVSCLDSGRREKEVLADLEAGKELGVTGTPAFFVNGRLLSGAQPYEAFAAIIDDELERARR